MDLITTEALKFIRKQRDRPFFLYVPFCPPLLEEDRWIRQYRTTIDSPSRRMYATSITHMDHAVGRLIQALEESEQRDSTCVVFFSDNGPVRGWIGELYDGCLRTQAFVNWPAVLTPGVIGHLTSVLDWFPTFAALADTSVDSTLRLEGRNIWPLLRLRKLPQPLNLYWRNYNGRRAALRSARSKLLVDRRTNDME